MKSRPGSFITVDTRNYVC